MLLLKTVDIIIYNLTLSSVHFGTLCTILKQESLIYLITSVTSHTVLFMLLISTNNYFNTNNVDVPNAIKSTKLELATKMQILVA